VSSSQPCGARASGTGAIANLAAGKRLTTGAEAELRALAAVETGCCPWATWTVRASATRLVLDVRSTGDGIAALHGMFTGLRQAPARAREPGSSAPGDVRL